MLVTASEVRQICRIDSDSEDSIIELFIQAVEGEIESVVNAQVDLDTYYSVSLTSNQQAMMRLAIIRYVGHFYNNRESTSPLNINDDPHFQSMLDALKYREADAEIVVDIVYSHAKQFDNPHSVSAADVGLGNVDNTADIDKPVSTLQQSAIDSVQSYAESNFGLIDSHISDETNPHNVNKSDVGLGAVDNTSDTDKPVSTAQAAAIAVVQSDVDVHEADTNNPHNVTLTQVGNPEFGNGSDGDIHITVDTTMSQAIWNCITLEIDASFTWFAPKWSVEFLPIITIRCQTPIILNGTISASSVTGNNDLGYVYDTGQDAIGYQTTRMPFDLCYDYYYSPVCKSFYYPVCGGSAYEDQSLLPIDFGDFPPVGYNNHKPTTNGYDTHDGYDISQIIGKNKPYRVCLGTGGNDFHGFNTAIPNGGGAILIYAPSIIFGAGGGIEANGGDGTYEDDYGDLGGTGGGGGGYVEINTTETVNGTYTWGKGGSSPVVATGDKAKCIANGGQGGQGANAGYDGMNGLVSFYKIGAA